MKVGLISLGCAKNLVDSEMVLGLLSSFDVEITNKANDADVIIVNTCGFIESAKEEAINTIFEMARYNKKLIVIGCLATRYYETLIEEIPEVDRFIKIADYSNFGEIFKSVTGYETRGGLSHLNRVSTTGDYFTYLRIADGCNNRCSYCAIPLIRGDYRSRNFDEIIIEAQNYANQGVKELVLISQDTTRYGTDFGNEEGISELLETIAKIEGFEFIRVLYLYPDDISDRLIQTIKNNPKITPYFDVPIQHASTKMLKLMNRRGSKEDLVNIISKIKSEIPHAVLRTTVIVGFPGETKEDFEELKEFIQNNRFDRLGAFKFSKEEDTKAYDMDNQVDEETKELRYKEIMKIQNKISYQQNKLRVGSVTTAIVTGYDQNMRKYKARDYGFAPDEIDGYLYLDSTIPLNVGDVVIATINDAYVYDLLGSVNCIKK